MSLLAQTPALPLDEAGEYVAGAYIVFVVLLVIYVGLMAAKLGRISRDLEELASLAESKQQQQAAGSRQLIPVRRFTRERSLRHRDLP